jgi:RHS repeat-associated protein
VRVVQGDHQTAGNSASWPRLSQCRGRRYCRARYYHPQLQRFISEDPLGFRAGDPNVYAYVGNSPVMFADPSGEIAPVIAAAVACGAGAVGGAAVVLSGRKPSWGGVALGAAIGCGGGLVVLGGWIAGAAAVAAVTTTEAATTAATALSGTAAIAASRALARAEPVGRALASDVYHRSATWMRDIAVRSGTHYSIQSGNVRAVLTQVAGELNGLPGRFEYIVNRAGQLTHQLFVRGGSINGVPSKP